MDEMFRWSTTDQQVFIAYCIADDKMQNVWFWLEFCSFD